MAIELVLKLLGRVPNDYHELQQEAPGKANLSFGNYNNRIINSVKFEMQFAIPRSDEFPLDDLFDEIDRRLEKHEYVIISIANPNGWHMYVIHQKVENGDYLAVSKIGPDGRDTDSINNVKEIVRNMKGTDILTYRFVE